MQVEYDKIGLQKQKEGDRITVSEAKKRANKKWNDANLKRYGIALPVEEAEEIDEFCKKKDISKNSFFREAAKEKIEREKQTRSIFMSPIYTYEVYILHKSYT